MKLGEAEAAGEAVLASGRAVADQVLAFSLDEQTFGVPLGLVAEIHRYQPLNRIPHMPKGVEGILDLRGQVIPVIDLRTRLGMRRREDHAGTTIVVVQVGAAKTGLLVDQVEGVIHRSAARFRPASRLLAGREGGWVTGFLVQDERLVALLDPTRTADSEGGSGGPGLGGGSSDLESRLDASLQALIALAPDRGALQGQVVPQITATIAHTEAEVEKVLVRVEAMLGAMDAIFEGVARLKQENALGRLKGEEPAIAELEAISQRIQDRIFHTLQTCQFQDIARQKLERVLKHIQGMQSVVGRQFREGFRKP